MESGFLRRGGVIAGAAWALAAALSGCSSAPTRPLTVEVQSESGQPIVGALVRVLPANPRHPLRISDYFASDLPPGPWVETGADGRARLSAYTEGPQDLVVTARGYAPWRRFFDAHPAAGGATGWLHAPAEGEEPGLRIRFE